MKKLSGFRVMLLLMVGLGMALTVLHLLTRPGSFIDLAFRHRNGDILATRSRKLKDLGGNFNGNGNSKGGKINQDDYHLVDPAPAPASVQHKTIEHGSPVIPYIPKPAPPISPPMNERST